MTGWKRWLGYAATIVGGLAVVGLGAYFVAVGLDRADKLASVIGSFVGLIGLAVSVYGVVLARRGLRQPPVTRGLTVDNVDARKGVDIVEAVGGSVRLGTSGPAAPIVPTAPAPPSPADQSITNVKTNGTIRVIRGVGGDVDIAP